MVTRSQSTLPLEIAPSWDAFIAEWCLGSPPILPPNIVIEALDALKRISPSQLNKLCAKSTRGPAVILPYIDLGSQLKSCEGLAGFHKLLPRIHQSDRSAFSEIHYAAALTRGSYLPELEPQVGTGFLDAAVDWEGGPIYTEVITPERAEEIVAAHADVQALATALCSAISGIVVEVLLHTDISPDTLRCILASLQGLPNDVPRTIEGFATVLQKQGSVPLILSPSLPSIGSSPIIAAAVGRVDGAQATAGIIRMPLLDSRARRLLSAELHHFSPKLRNVLAIDITGVSIGPKNWAPLIQRSFQPTQNRRVGAVILFSSALCGIPLAIRQVWKVVLNQYAYQPIPGAFLDVLTSQDESSFIGAAPPVPSV